MGKKRKADGRPPEHLSAFAARKGGEQRPFNDISDQVQNAPSEPRNSGDDPPSVKRKKLNQAAPVIQPPVPKWQKRKKTKTRKPKRPATNQSGTQQASSEITTSNAAATPASVTTAGNNEAHSLSQTPLYDNTLKGLQADRSKGDSIPPATTDIRTPDPQPDDSLKSQLQPPLHASSKTDILKFPLENEVDDSYDIEDESDIGSFSASPDVVTPSTSAIKKLSTFVPSKDNVIGQTDQEWTINLTGETITLLGQFEIWVREGAISTQGAILYPSSMVYTIYAPSTHALPPIRSIRNPYRPSDQQAIITISNHRSGIRLLKEISAKFDRLWHRAKARTDEPRPSADLSRRTFALLKDSSNDGLNRPLHSLEPPSGWQTLITTLAPEMRTDQPKRVLICGPKGSGKSTFSRMLINAILTKPPAQTQLANNLGDGRCIALLDVDPGQPEFSPPGEVSLVQISTCICGPPFTHPTASGDGVKLVRSHHVGTTTSRHDPTFYLRCIDDLLRYYEQILVNHPTCPLVISTAGWVQGSGLEILVDLIQNISPTDVIYTSTVGPAEAVDSVSKATVANQSSLHFLTSQPVENVPRSAADLRMMQTLSYFHLDEPERGHLRWDPTPIYEMIPLSVHYAGPSQAIYGVQVLGQELDPEFLIQVLEGCIVGIVVVEDDAALPFPFEARKPDDGTNDEAQAVDEADRTTPPPPDEQMDYSLMSIDTRTDMVYTPKPNFNASVFRHHREEQNPGTPVTPYDPASPSTPFDPAQGTHPIQLPTPSPTQEYNLHPPLPRTLEQIPYIPSTHHVTPPLCPTHSHSIGQAFVQSIDTENHIFNLITPVPLAALNNLHQQQKKLVLVRGNLDTPTWAYKEDLYKETRRRKRIIKEGLWGGEVKTWDKGDTKRWAEGRPWVRAGERGKGERMRSGRKDLGKKRKEGGR
ncbi:MAG: hypothetical protein Q9181_007002 [Wetmoreana brouardii]